MASKEQVEGADSFDINWWIRALKETPYENPAWTRFYRGALGYAQRLSEEEAKTFCSEISRIKGNHELRNFKRIKSGSSPSILFSKGGFVAMLGSSVALGYWVIPGLGIALGALWTVGKVFDWISSSDAKVSSDTKFSLKGHPPESQKENTMNNSTKAPGSDLASEPTSPDIIIENVTAKGPACVHAGSHIRDSKISSTETNPDNSNSNANQGSVQLPGAFGNVTLDTVKVTGPLTVIIGSYVEGTEISRTGTSSSKAGQDPAPSAPQGPAPSAPKFGAVTLKGVDVDGPLTVIIGSHVARSGIDAKN